VVRLAPLSFFCHTNRYIEITFYLQMSEPRYSRLEDFQDYSAHSANSENKYNRHLVKILYMGVFYCSGNFGRNSGLISSKPSKEISI
jgi:hypothetical protein